MQIAIFSTNDPIINTLTLKQSFVQADCCRQCSNSIKFDNVIDLHENEVFVLFSFTSDMLNKPIVNVSYKLSP